MKNNISRQTSIPYGIGAYIYSIVYSRFKNEALFGLGYGVRISEKQHSALEPSLLSSAQMLMPSSLLDTDRREYGHNCRVIKQGIICLRLGICS